MFFQQGNLAHFKARWSRRKHLNSSSHHCLGNRRITLPNQGSDPSRDHAALLGMKTFLKSHGNTGYKMGAFLQNVP